MVVDKSNFQKERHMYNWLGFTMEYNFPERSMSGAKILQVLRSLIPKISGQVEVATLQQLPQLQRYISR